MSSAGALLEGFSITNGNSGGITMSGGTVRQCDVNRNSGYSGAGVSMTGGLLEDSRVALNTARATPGVYVNGAGVTVRRCTIEQNQGNYTDGSGVGLGVNMAAAGLVDSCIIRSNYNVALAGGTGRGAGASLTAGTMRNCLVVGNLYTNKPGQTCTSQGAGVWLQGGVVENCTIADNVAGTEGGGLYMSGGAVTNCIVYYNSCIPDNPSSNNVGKTGGVFAYSCATPLEAGTGNTNASPVFVNRAAGNYRVQGNSPTRDSGATATWMATATDLDGSARIHGSAPDMGCYEGVYVGGTLFLFR
jgi:hypothetical protein